MTPEEQRELVIQNIAGMLRETPFTFTFKVVKKPKGIKIIHEVTQEELDAVMRRAAESRGNVKL